MKNTQRVLREGRYKADLARQRESHLTTSSVQIPENEIRLEQDRDYSTSPTVVIWRYRPKAKSAYCRTIRNKLNILHYF